MSSPISGVRSVHLSVLFVFVLLLAGCSTFAGKNRFPVELIEYREAERLGAAFLNEYRSQPSRFPEESIQVYVSNVARSVSQHTGGTYKPGRVIVIEDVARNSFALPGGPVFITTGFLGMIDNEAQLSAVIAHHFAHLNQRHFSEYLSFSAGYPLVKRVVKTVQKRGSFDYNQNTKNIREHIDRIIKHGYTRRQELEADQLSLRYVRKAGYNPRAVKDLLEKLQDREAQPAALGDMTTERTTEISRMKHVKNLLKWKYTRSDRTLSLTYNRLRFINNTKALREWIRKEQGQDHGKKKPIGTDGKLVDYYYKQGKKKFAEEDWQGAREQLKSVLERQSNHFDALVLLARTYMKLKPDHRKATVLLRRALSLRPDVPDVHYHLGRAYMNQNRSNLAKIQFQEVKELTSGQDELYKRAEKYLNRLE